MKVFGISLLSAAVIFLVGFLVAKHWPNLFGSIPVLGAS